MNIKSNKLEIAVLVLAIAFGYGVYKVLGAMKGQPQLSDESITYVMPRPESEVSTDWDLADREIERTFENPFEAKEKAAQADVDTQKQKKMPASVVDNKKKTKKSSQSRKSKTDIKVVNSEDSISENMKDQSVTQEQTDEAQPEDGNFEEELRQQKQKNSANNQPKPEKENLLPEQWKSLLLSQPTPENMQKLIKAFESGDIDATAYYEVLGALLKSSSSNAQAVGLQGAKAFPTGKSFILVAQNIENLRRDSKGQAEAFLDSFAQASKFPALAQAMTLGDVDVAKLAVEVLLKSKTGQVSNDPRSLRGDGTSAPAGYSQFVQIFNRWKESDNLALRSLAQGALSALT